MRFSKLHGAGNDYIYVDARAGERDWPELARRVSDRHFGIGSDGLILLKNSEFADAKMQMFNADGSEGMMCGNGIRCFIRFGLVNSALKQTNRSFDIETASGVLNVRPIWDSGVLSRASVSMGAPIFRPSDIPVDAPDEMNPLLDYPITVDRAVLLLTCVSMGNPHAVMFLDQPIEDYPLTTIGPGVENHPVFLARVNFEIVNVIDSGRIRVRVWERGSGITLACGTAACAAVVAARMQGLVGNKVAVEMPGGDLEVSWSGDGEVILEGPVAHIFDGDWPE